MPIPVFVGGGKRQIQMQMDIFESLCVALTERNLKPSIFLPEYWSFDDPVGGVVRYMRECSGCLIFCVPRYHAPELIEFPGTESAQPTLGLVTPTCWDYIEATVAFTQGLPLLSIVDETVHTQAILSTRYPQYHAYKCALRDNQPSLSQDVLNLLDQFADRVTTRYQSSIEAGLSDRE